MTEAKGVAHGLARRLFMPAFGLGQIISWGSLYYALAVLAAPIRAEMAFSEVEVFGAFTLALFLSGVAAPAVGRMIDARGGRLPMVLGSVLGGAAFVTIGAAPNFPVFLLGWALAGLAMAGSLYEAAFATLNRMVAPEDYRRAVTTLTLFGGFASTAFWPLTHVLIEGAGWRNACFLYAALQFLYCLPVHAWLIPAARPAPAKPGTEADSAPAASSGSHRFSALAAAFASNAFIFSVMSVYLIPMLGWRGLSTAEAIGIAALVGPFQVGARMLEYALAGRLPAVRVGAVSFGAILLALFLLAVLQGLSPLAFVFIGLYGASNGIMTIARGTVPAELFGRDGYGALLGRLARPSFIAKAAAPGAFALLMADGMDFDHGLFVLIAIAALGWWSYQWAVVRKTA